MRSRAICWGWGMVWLWVVGMGSVEGSLMMPGDLAFMGFNADGDDDFALVLLADAGAGTLVRFSDREWQGSAFNTGEGAVTWTLSQALAAGTVVTFSRIDSTSNPGFGPSSGVLSGALQLAVGGDTLYAFLGPSASTPSTFLAAITNAAGDFDSTTGTLTGTGLTLGTTAVLLPPGTRGGEYVASRSNQASFANYLPVIGDPSENWTLDMSADRAVLPFDTGAFTESSAVPEPGTWSLGILVALCVGLARRRRGGEGRMKEEG